MFGDLLDLDFGSGGWGDFDFSDLDFSGLDLTDLGDLGDLGEQVLDTVTGEYVDISTLSPEDLADLDGGGDVFGDGAGGEYAGPLGGEPLESSPISTSKSDYLRSLEGGNGIAPGSEPFHGLSTDYGYPDSGFNWGKALSGLGSGLGSLGKGLTGLGGDSGGSRLLELGGGGMSASPGSVPGLTGGGGGLASLAPSPEANFASLPGVGVPERLGLSAQSPIGAALSRLQAEPGALRMQEPIPEGKPIPPFTPLQIALGGGPQTPPQPATPRLSGLQALLAQRRG